MFRELESFRNVAPGLFGICKGVFGILLVFLILGLGAGLVGGLGLTW